MATVSLDRAAAAAQEARPLPVVGAAQVVVAELGEEAALVAVRASRFS